MTKSFKDICCRNILFHEEFDGNTLEKASLAAIFVAVDYGYVLVSMRISVNVEFCLSK
jgi:hypothetical protein